MTQPNEQSAEQNLIPVGTPKKEDLEQEAKQAHDLAVSIVIDSPIMYGEAAEELINIKTQIKNLSERRLEITRPMDAAKKSVMDLFKAPISKLESAETVLKRALRDWDDKQEAIALAARKEAEVLAEQERQNLMAKAEEAEEHGDAEAAMTYATTAQMVTAAPAPQTEAPAKVSGISTTTRWKAEVTDKAAFIRHALDNPEYFDMVTIDMKPLNQLAVAMKDKMNVPGVKALGEKGITART